MSLRASEKFAPSVHKVTVWSGIDDVDTQIVEELVLKAIHSEGSKLASESGRCSTIGPVRTFPSRSVITFRLLKSLSEYVKGLEVAASRYWEWENAIFDGADLYFRLRAESQGTVTIDMNQRSISFSPDVFIALPGAAVGAGLARACFDMESSEIEAIVTAIELGWTASALGVARLVAAKRAIMQALDVNQLNSRELSLKLIDGRYPSIKASGAVQSEIWARRVITFQLAFAEDSTGVLCTASAITDVKDVA